MHLFTDTALQCIEASLAAFDQVSFDIFQQSQYVCYIIEFGRLNSLLSFLKNINYDRISNCFPFSSIQIEFHEMMTFLAALAALYLALVTH